MALNKYMHPRNPFFKNPPDFSKLAKVYPELSKYCKFESDSKCSIDFRDPFALKSLSCTLLKDLYDKFKGLTVEMPTDHLIPRVPQRINYILWLEDLLEKPLNCIGIDIGCGTCCIYGLIACSINKNWQLVGSEISEENINWSKKNIISNNLQDKIHVIKVDEKTFLLDLISKIDQDKKMPGHLDTIDFIMCNPPFFSNESEHFGRSKTRKLDKRPEPSSTNTGQLHESIYNGGETVFIKKIIDESLEIGNRIKIYTTMMGKKSSLNDIKSYLVNEKKITNISSTQFCQGHTMRWAIAWSFDAKQLKEFNYKKMVEQQILKPQFSKPLKLIIDKNLAEIKNISSKLDAYELVREFVLKNLKFEIEREDKKLSKIIFYVKEKTWTNRKERRNQAKCGNMSNTKTLEEKFKFVCQIDLLPNENIEIKLNLARDMENFKLKNYLNEIYEFLKNHWKNPKFKK